MHRHGPILESMAGRERAAPALIDFPAGQERCFSYGQVERAVSALAAQLDSVSGEQPVFAFLAAPQIGWAVALLAIWARGGIAVPLSVSATPAELAHIVDDTRPRAVLIDGELHAQRERLPTVAGLLQLAERCGVDVLVLGAPDCSDGAPPLHWARRDDERVAYVVYTSGTTGKPKGVPTTHGNLRAQLQALHTAWQWSSRDRIVNVLPLHHVHGIMGVVLSALYAGAACELAPRFCAKWVWRRLLQADEHAGRPPLTLFMAVPTVYHRLVQAHDHSAVAATRAACQQLRLMVSGSAALPHSLHHKWQALTGHTLLERYGMTEFGLAISNPLDVHGRLPGYVGQPLPGYRIRLVAASDSDTETDSGSELQVSGPAVFHGYWRRAHATEQAFVVDEDGVRWFRTGDVAAVERMPDGRRYVRILGRASLDVFKCRGYKISALEIERVMLDHPAVSEIAVVGVPDPALGDAIVACVLRDAAAPPPSQRDLIDWAKTRLSWYKLPTAVHFVDQLPRNAMGKVSKAVLIAQFKQHPIAKL